MKQYLSLIFALSMVVVLALLAIYFKNSEVKREELRFNLGNFAKQKSCARHPSFLEKLKIPQPIAIDLSQQNHKGLAFLYGQGLRETLYFKPWGAFDHFSTYALDPTGRMYLSPMPFISIKPNTFAFQENIYCLESDSGNLAVWMHLDEVKSGKGNPYGIIALDYDCDDHTLWVSAIDESDYGSQKGVIYHIDIEHKKILRGIEGIDALSLELLKTKDGNKYLLYGSARESGLFALHLKEDGVSDSVKLFDLPVANEYVRKIKVREDNLLEIQTIPFSYSLVAQTATSVRKNYEVMWHSKSKEWVFQ